MMKDVIEKKRLERGNYWNKALSIVSGCTPVSIACDNCWSKSQNERFFPETDFSKIIPVESRLQSLKRVKPTIYAVWNDLFHEDIPFEFIDKAISEMESHKQHYYLILTKRPQRMLEWYGGVINLKYREFDKLKNILFGTTVEHEDYLNRINFLTELPVQSRFISVEPMLGPVSLRGIDHEKISWVVCGSESGRNPRVTKAEWVESLRDECKEFGIPFFLKQLRDETGNLVKLPELNGKIYSEYPNV